MQSTCSLKICFTIFVFCLRDASVSKNTNQFLVFVFLCCRYKKTHKHKKHIGSLLQFYCWKRKTKKNWSMCFCVFRKKTQKHIDSLVLFYCWKKTKKIWSLCFCVFHKKNTKTQKHIGPLVQFYCWKKHNQKFGPCVFVFFVKKHKNTKTHRLSGAVLLLKKRPKKKHKNTKTHCVSDAISVGGNQKSRIGFCTSRGEYHTIPFLAFFSNLKKHK